MVGGWAHYIFIFGNFASTSFAKFTVEMLKNGANVKDREAADLIFKKLNSRRREIHRPLAKGNFTNPYRGNSYFAFKLTSGAT